MTLGFQCPKPNRFSFLFIGRKDSDMRQIMLLIFFFGSFSTSTLVFSDTFEKHGNNGTVSCNTFCGGAKWGNTIGSCVSAYNKKSGKQESCNSVPGLLGGPELTCNCASGKLPIRVKLSNTVGSHWYMDTKIVLSKNGRLDGKTTTKSCQRKGFTGGVWASLLDKDKNILYISRVHSYGINGKGFDNKCKKRSAPWNENISINIVNKVGGIVIHHARNPKERVSKKDVYEAIEKGMKIYTASQTGG